MFQSVSMSKCRCNVQIPNTNRLTAGTMEHRVRGDLLRETYLSLLCSSLGHQPVPYFIVLIALCEAAMMIPVYLLTHEMHSASRLCKQTIWRTCASYCTLYT